MVTVTMKTGPWFRRTESSITHRRENVQTDNLQTSCRTKYRINNTTQHDTTQHDTTHRSCTEINEIRAEATFKSWQQTGDR